MEDGGRGSEHDPGPLCLRFAWSRLPMTWQEADHCYTILLVTVRETSCSSAIYLQMTMEFAYAKTRHFIARGVSVECAATFAEMSQWLSATFGLSATFTHHSGLAALTLCYPFMRGRSFHRVTPPRFCSQVIRPLTFCHGGRIYITQHPSSRLPFEFPTHPASLPAPITFPVSDLSTFAPAYKALHNTSHSACPMPKKRRPDSKRTRSGIRPAPLMM